MGKLQCGLRKLHKDELHDLIQTSPYMGKTFSLNTKSAPYGHHKLQARRITFILCSLKKKHLSALLKRKI
jgi:hypothetical protein